jgi:hypothetical protein
VVRWASSYEEEIFGPGDTGAGTRLRCEGLVWSDVLMGHVNAWMGSDWSKTKSGTGSASVTTNSDVRSNKKSPCGGPRAGERGGGRWWRSRCRRIFDTTGGSRSRPNRVRPGRLSQWTFDLRPPDRYDGSPEFGIQCKDAVVAMPAHAGWRNESSHPLQRNKPQFGSPVRCRPGQPIDEAAVIAAPHRPAGQRQSCEVVTPAK